MSPKKHKKCVIDHRTKIFCSILKFSFGFNGKHSNLDLRSSLLKSDSNSLKYINFKIDKLISTFRVLPVFGVMIFTMHVY